MYNIYVMDDKMNIINIQGYSVGYISRAGKIFRNNKLENIKIGKFGKIYLNDEIVGSLENKIICIMKNKDPFINEDEFQNIGRYEYLEFENPYFYRRTQLITDFLKKHENYEQKNPMFIDNEKIKFSFRKPNELEKLLKELFKIKYNNPLEMFKPQEFEKPYNIEEPIKMSYTELMKEYIENNE